MWMICRRTDEERIVDGGDSFLQTHALWAFRVARQWLWLVHPWAAMACLSSCGNMAIFFAFPVWVGMVRMSQESRLLWSNYIASGLPRTLNSTLCVGTKRIVRTENQRKLKALTFFCCLDGRDEYIYWEIDFWRDHRKNVHLLHFLSFSQNSGNNGLSSIINSLLPLSSLPNTLLHAQVCNSLLHLMQSTAPFGSFIFCERRRPFQAGTNWTTELT